MSLLTPSRRRGIELLDDPAVADAVRARSIADVARANRLLGGRRAALLALAETLRTLPPARDRSAAVTLLDVGTGHGDLPAAAHALAGRAGARLHTIGLDTAESLAHAARPRMTHAMVGDALALPFASRSVDVVLCSQLLHHFEGEPLLAVLRELHRVARHRVIVCDLRRSWLAAGGFWLVAFPLRFHRVTRHDGVVSVLRGFTARELAALVREATGRTPDVRRRLGWRLTATWAP